MANHRCHVSIREPPRRHKESDFPLMEPDAMVPSGKNAGDPAVGTTASKRYLAPFSTGRSGPLQSFKRRTPVLVLSGVWCGDWLGWRLAVELQKCNNIQAGRDLQQALFEAHGNSLQCVVLSLQ
jgi:hypothetical protein